MFYPFDLVFETNKLIGRFKSSGFKVITEIMAEFKDPKIILMFAQLLHDFNIRIKNIDDIFKDIFPQDEVAHHELQAAIEEKFLDRLYQMMNVNLFEVEYNFVQLYDHLYWDKMYSFVKELWTAMPEDKPVRDSKKGFKDLFEEIHDDVVMKYPTIFVKRLTDVGSMYRCRSWNVNDDYELMIPNEQYVKDNRWNPDGVAYLYLACGDANESYVETVNMVQKTCFEEIRLKDGSEVAVCQFKPIKKNAKIIDLCYEGIELSKLSRELKVPPEEYSQAILAAINDRTHLNQIMKELAQVNTKDDFHKKADPYLKKLIKHTGLEKKIEEIVYSRTSTILLGLIDESIFEAVDKNEDPDLKAYLPFRAFSRFLIKKGYDGIIYRSTRMNKIGLSGKNLVLFDKMHATYIELTMEKYKYSLGGYTKL